MICQVCKVREAQVKSTVCSNRCNNVRLAIIRMDNTYTPTPGCENCWGDLHQGCTEKCKEEFRISREFISDLYSLIRMY